MCQRLDVLAVYIFVILNERNVKMAEKKCKCKAKPEEVKKVAPPNKKATLKLARDARNAGAAYLGAVHSLFAALIDRGEVSAKCPLVRQIAGSAEKLAALLKDKGY